MAEPEKGGNFFKNAKASDGRAVRLEVVGDVTENERHFLEGMVLFMSATLSRDDDKRVCWVSQRMAKLVRSVVDRMRGAKGEEPA